MFDPYYEETTVLITCGIGGCRVIVPFKWEPEDYGGRDYPTTPGYWYPEETQLPANLSISSVEVVFHNFEHLEQLADDGDALNRVDFIANSSWHENYEYPLEDLIS